MKARLSTVLAAILVSAGRMSAQSPFQEYFKVQGRYANDPVMFVPTSASGGFWAYSSPYRGALAPTSAGTFADVMVWCVDESHESYSGQNYPVWITPLSSSDFTRTRLGAADRTEYQWAAYLAGQMELNWGLAAAQQQTAALQDAMWAILGEGYDPTGRLNTFEGSGGYGPGLGITTSTNFAIAPGSFLDPSGWGLVTCDPGLDPTGHPKPVSSCAGQEFLIQLPGGPREVTPEPGALTLLGTGLAGVMGVGLRRRKKRGA